MRASFSWSIRDLLWLTLVVALTLTGWMNYTRLSSEVERLSTTNSELEREFMNYSPELDRNYETWGRLTHEDVDEIERSIGTLPPLENIVAIRKDTSGEVVTSIADGKWGATRATVLHQVDGKWKIVKEVPWNGGVAGVLYSKPGQCVLSYSWREVDARVVSRGWWPPRMVVT